MIIYVINKMPPLKFRISSQLSNRKNTKTGAKVFKSDYKKLDLKPSIPICHLMNPNNQQIAPALVLPLP